MRGKGIRLWMIIAAIAALALLTFYIAIPQKPDPLPSVLAGNWASKQTVTVRVHKENYTFDFIKSNDSVVLNLNILPNNQVTGGFGKAVVQDGRIQRNNEFFESPNKETNRYIILGRLKGFIFEGDTILEKVFTIPCTFKNDTLRGNVLAGVPKEYMHSIARVNLAKTGQ